MSNLPKFALDARKLREAATPGPWRATQTPWPRIIQTNHITRDIREIADLGDHYGIPTTRQVEEDTAFIAAAPTNQELLERALELATEALDKIRDPRKRDHKEPDKYTELGCVMNIADEALALIHALGGKNE